MQLQMLSKWVIQVPSVRLKWQHCIELDILKGGTQLIKTFKPIVIIETNGNMAIVEYMKMLDFTIFDMELIEFKEMDTLPLNVFCVPHEANL